MVISIQGNFYLIEANFLSLYHSVFAHMIHNSDTLSVHSIESFGTHDGPGIRMVVFLQGCNIKCLYCQNADTIVREGGQDYTIEDLVKRAVNMKSYFGKRGGVTVSGGEPLLQSKGLIKFFKRLKEEGIHTNIDTNGTVFNTDSKNLIDNYADLLMIDLKGATIDGFKRITGVNGFETSLKFIEHREASNKPFWLRYVLVPGYTDQMVKIVWLRDTFKGYKNITKVEILPYHKLGIYKWEALGEKYQLEDVPENTPEQTEKVLEVLKPYFKEVVIK